MARADLSDALRAYVPDLPLAALSAGAVAFALIWRGVLSDRLDAISSPAISIALTCISFGVRSRPSR